MATYVSGKEYTRKSIMLGLGVTDTGGAWFTGHIRHMNEHYIFCNITSESRTGHNFFEGADLVWHSRKGANLTNGVAADLISNTLPVHIFCRLNNRFPFSYYGMATALSWSQGESVQIKWRFNQEFLPEEIQPNVLVTEGAKRQVLVNAYERDSNARAICIKKWGVVCVVCGFDFGQRYGEIGEGYIHVHHLVPISAIGEQDVLDPENDLRPVCPNCHAMLHRSTKNVMSINELKKLLI